MLTRMYLYSTSTKLSIDVWLYLDRPGSLFCRELIVLPAHTFKPTSTPHQLSFVCFISRQILSSNIVSCNFMENAI